MSNWPKVVLFGDSITQRSFEEGGWGALIANQVQRKCDIICRGFSGYNTKWASAGKAYILPSELLQNVAMATIFFGANDACLPELQPEKHVPVENYTLNLKPGESPNNIPGKEKFTRQIQAIAPSVVLKKVLGKCDVVNRGFSGYNSRWARMVLSTALPMDLIKDTVAITVFFGANDSVIEEVWPCQFVGVQEYADNMKAIVNHFVSNGLSKDKILLITPPPIDETQWTEQCKEKGTALNRTLKISGIYAKACLNLAKDVDVKVIDIWNKMQEEENWGERFLCDGLHLSSDGAGFLYKQLSGFVDDLTSSLPQQFPDWSEVDYANPEKSFQQS